jgi:hypothetical protein
MQQKERCVKLSSNVISVKDFGAVGDGATNDRVAIQNAVQAASILGGIVYFPPGTYNIDSAVVLLSGVTLLGAGPSASVIRSTSASDNLIMCTSAINATIRDLQLESVVPRNSGAGIYFDSVGQ